MTELITNPYAYSPVMGVQRPRIFCMPKFKSLNAATEALATIELTALDLDNWQKWFFTYSLAEKDYNKWAAFEVALIVARQNGKTVIAEAREIAGLFTFREELIIHTAHEYKTAEESFLRLLFWIQDTPDLDNEVFSVRTAAGEQGIILKKRKTTVLPDGTIIPGEDHAPRIRFIARSRTSGRGFTADTLVWDEAMVLDAGMVGSSLPTLRTRPNPQVWYLASAGLRTSTQLAAIRRRGIAAWESELKGIPLKFLSLLFGEWSINWHTEYCDPDCTEHDDPTLLESVAKANPALGIRISAETVENEREAMRFIPGEFDREILSIGEYPAPDEGWMVIPEAWWNKTSDDEEIFTYHYPVFSVVINRERTVSSIGVAGIRPDGTIGIDVAAGPQRGTKWLIQSMEELDKTHKPVRWVIDPHGGTGTILDLMLEKGYKVEKMSASDVTVACGQIFDAFRDEELKHRPHKALRAALAGADRRTLEKSWAWSQSNSATEISPLLAVTNALWGYLKFGQQANYEISKSVHFGIKQIVHLFKTGIYGSDDLIRLKDRGLVNDELLSALREEGLV